MEVKKISSENTSKNNSYRPGDFESFIGQEEIKKLLKTAIDSARKRDTSLGHLLFSGESGYGKTTLAKIVGDAFGKDIKIISGYAILKPSEIISILSNLEQGDILFIDEIHRIKPNVEEVLYIAMEDFFIDMVMPEGGSVRVPINNFTLIGATTKMESLTNPLKNRFVYKFHFCEYSKNEKIQIIKTYLEKNDISYDESVIGYISDNVVAVPREINNLCLKIRDYLISYGYSLYIDYNMWKDFKNWADISYGGLESIHKKYLDLLDEFGGGPIGLKTISLRMGLTEKAVEEDLEPLLMKLGKIEKTSRGRTLKH